MTRPTRDHRQLHQLISGLTDGIVLIDLDETILWANRAAIDMHGVGRLADLGRDLDDYRERFRLARRDKSPLIEGDIAIDRLLRGEKSEPVLVEVVPADDPDDLRIHSIRFQLITDDDGEPDYLVMVVEDETARIEAEDRFESAFNANPAPAIICRLKDLRFVRVNRGFTEMTGFERRDVVGRSAYELDILAGSADREQAIERLRAGETIPQTEADLALPGGEHKRVLVAGQPIDIADEPSMLFTFADLEPRRQAERSLRQSEERFAKAFRLSPAATAIVRLDPFGFIEVNDAFADLLGRPKEEILGEGSGLLDGGPSATSRIAAALAHSPSLSDLEVSLKSGKGGRVEALLSAERILIGSEDCALCALQDVTERKRTEAELVTAIETVMSDTSWFSRRIVEKLASLRQPQDAAPPSSDLGDLSEREREVLGLICQGLGDKEMAAALHLSPHTVRNHVASLYRKIGVTRRSAAIVWARERSFPARAGSPVPPRRES
ncbi:helix-turn-helix transcriptional regulator [Aureimonas pseudogalii]|uniref:PAS domain S-box-containing protein n=1 Tax=Aureimonas pseudogalii TaxID=1744844 RepID=A0A7W6H7H5_9HYPH|nr:PAS domain S-box protein [Aureimonas pseudogalii]MBB4000044.1 PAS domain S-box-containing protein [Aureimonas pseudogalii]